MHILCKNLASLVSHSGKYCICLWVNLAVGHFGTYLSVCNVLVGTLYYYVTALVARTRQTDCNILMHAVYIFSTRLRCVKCLLHYIPFYLLKIASLCNQCL